MSENTTTQSFVDELAADEYDYVAIDELNEHPKNTEVYGEIDPDESFIEDIKRNGIETPLVVNEHEDCPNTVIGGHRRLEAAKIAGLNRVPVRWVSYPEPLATRRLVLNNKQRDKSPGQQSREALILEETARELDPAGQGTRNDTSSQLGRSSYRWDEDVAEQIGVSKNTVRRGTDVFRMAYPDEYVRDDLRNVEKYDVSEDVREVARQQAELMDNDEQSFHGAYTAIQDAKEQTERKERYETDAKAQQKASEDARESWDVSGGDIWELESENTDEPHRIVCGDGLDSDVLNALLGDVTPDLAYADPPYGIGDDVNRGQGSTTGFQTSYEFPDIEGDSTIESAVAAHRRFTEMDIPRIVLWGANHYAHELPPSQGWLVWDKRDGVESDDYADCELAWTNLDNAARVFRHLWRGAIKASEKNERRIHPTQKPIALAEWCIETYCDDVSSVFDPFLGSGSTLLGADACGVPCYGVEMSEDYVAAILERASAHGLEPTRVGVVSE